MKSLFFPYSHADEALRNELEKHLAALRREGTIKSWHDRRISAGQEFGQEIDQHLSEADVILLLFSADFIASDYCYAIEAQAALRRHEAGEARVIPVILRPCDWKNTPFKKLLAAPQDGRAVTQWEDRDEAFLDIVTKVRAALDSLSNARATAAAEEIAPSNRFASARSINLRLKRSFSDHEKDLFLSDSFDFIKSFFKNSLTELDGCNPGIKSRFQEVDARAFEASIYVQGSMRSKCGVWWGDTTFRSSILYSSAGVSKNSFNESLSVEHDSQSLYLRPLGMAYGLGRREASSRLSPQDAAEYLWGILISPLQ